MTVEVFILLLYLYAGFCVFLTQKKDIEKDATMSEPGQKLLAATLCICLWFLYPVVHWLFGDD